jgi:NAD(P)H-hydrate epimerase
MKNLSPKERFYSFEDIKCLEKICGLPEMTLMERAAESALLSITKKYGDLAKKKFVILAGKGNNAGDAFALARLLAKEGALINLFLVLGETFHGCTKQNYEKLKETEVKIHGAFDESKFKNCDFIIDGVFGTGLSREPSNEIKQVFDLCELSKKPLIALDLPSGMNADTGLGSMFQADLTITFVAKKIGFLLHEAANSLGELDYYDLGIEAECYKKVNGLSVSVITENLLQDSLPERNYKSHKYTNGSLLVVAGSKKFQGAPVLSARGASLAGAGMLFVAVPASIASSVSIKLTEEIILPILSEAGGCIQESSIYELTEQLKKTSCLLAGCGLGRHKRTSDFVCSLLAEYNGPLVLDADGLDILQRREVTLPANTLLTPHWGEFKKIIEFEGDCDYFERLKLAREFALKKNCVLLLKGFPSIVACPTGELFVNQTRCYASTKAGFGDVLAGMASGLMVQGLNALQAACMALYISTKAAEQYSLTGHENCMTAQDLYAEIPKIMRQFHQ